MSYRRRRQRSERESGRRAAEHASIRHAQDLIAIVGPTAAGKSALASWLAKAVGGEIVNADSMQLYRGMDIGTAKPTPAERAEVPHHCYDVLDVTDTASVVAYQQLAAAAIERVRDRDRIPILVGGSGLYIRAVVDEIDFPGTDPTVRARLERELVDVGAEVLHQRLTSLDPVAAQAILPTNGRRIVRALEVCELTGEPFSARMPSYRDRAGLVQLGIDHAELDERIESRVDAMFDAGLVAEVRALEPHGLRRGVTASRALGYREVLAMLDGEYDEATARMAVQTATRRFARRQRSWFRRDPRVRWLDAATDLHDQVRRTLDV